MVEIKKAIKIQTQSPLLVLIKVFSFLILMPNESITESKVLSILFISAFCAKSSLLMSIDICFNWLTLE